MTRDKFSRLRSSVLGRARVARSDRLRRRPTVRQRRLLVEPLEDRRMLSLAVSGTTPELTDATAPLSTIDVTFNNPIDPATFGNRDVALLDLANLETATLGSTGGAFHSCVTDGSLLYATTDTGLQILDVSNPAAMTRLGGFETAGDGLGIHVVGNLAYTADNNGLQILDVSNPTAVARLGGYSTPSNAFAVQVVGNLAYVAEFTAGLEILNVSNPAAVTRVGGYDTPGYAWNVQVVGDRAYVADYGEGLQILNVFDPAAVTRLGGYDTPDEALDVQVVGNRAYVADDSSGLVVLDVSNPAAVMRLGGFDTAGRALGVQVLGNLAYVADADAGLQILDVTNPAAVTRRGGFFTSGWTDAVQVVGNRAYVVDFGVQILDVSNPVAVTRLGRYHGMGDARAVQTVGNRAYVADGRSLAILDVSNPAALAYLGGFHTGNATEYLHVVGNRAYVTDQGGGLYILDVSNPAAVTRLGGYGLPSWALGVQVVGNLAYVADYESLEILDVSNPAAVTRRGGYVTSSGGAFDVKVVGNRAYVAGYAGLQILDVSNPAAVTRLGGYGLPSWALGVQVVGSLAYVTGEDSSVLHILDVSNPAAVTRLGGFSAAGDWGGPSRCHAAQVVGNLAFVADERNGFHILNVSNPAAVTRVGGYTLSASTYDVQVVGNLAYVTDWKLGLVVVEVGLPAASISHVAGNTYRVDLGRTLPEGAFTLLLGPEILDPAGTAMDQDLDGTPREESDDMYFASFRVDMEIPPTVTTLSPADGATSVPLVTNLLISFSEDIQPGTGNIVIKKASDHSVVETIAVTSAQVTVSGAQATIDPSATFDPTTGYYIQIAGGAFEDLSHNGYAGISDTTTWSFTTRAASTIAGQAFSDLDANGLKDAGEPGRSGWTIYLDADLDGQLDLGETYTATLADGTYRFADLAAGTYAVSEVQQTGWTRTYPSGVASATERVSVATDGTQANAASTSGSISADGRYVAFGSSATSLVPGDTNARADVFVYDRQTDTTERVSVTAGGTQGNENSTAPSISADGRYVAFGSSATNLVSGDTNAKADIFVYDRQTDTIERVSVTAAGVQGNDASSAASISADGRYVAFGSLATNLVSGDTNAKADIFVYDRQTDTIERVSVTAAGVQGNDASSAASISADGRYVAFGSLATNLVSGDTNAKADIFVYDRQTDTIERVSLAAGGTQGNDASTGGSISADGRYVAFGSLATNLVSGDTNAKGDVFVYDRQTDTIERVSLAAGGTQGDAVSSAPSISADSRYVAFYSSATNLVSGDTNARDDIFVYDRQADTIQRVSLAADGTQGDASSSAPKISADGRYVAFGSSATNLVPGDTNAAGDVFVRVNPLAWVSGSYVVVVAAGQDVSGIDFGNHDIASPTLSSLAPTDNATGVGAAPNLVITLNEDIQLGTGNIVIKKSSDSSVVESIDIGSAQVTVSGATATIDPTTTLAENTDYYVEVDAGALKDLSGHDFAGISDPTAWNFTTGEFTVPTADIVDVTPDPRTSAVSSITIVFSEAVTGLDLVDLTLTRNGGGNLLSDAQTLSTADDVTWVLEDLSSLTSTAGSYQLQLTAEGAGIENSAGNALVADASDSWTVYATVSGRQIFYNQSYFDKNSPAANADDDAAIATDKQVLLPGGTASFANYTSYSRGLNGLMIDVQNLPATPTVDDFLFRRGNDDKPYGTDLSNPADDWAWAPAPLAIAVRAGAGLDGADRVTLIWADGVIHNCWLQVTLRATDTTGLAADDVFYVGNAVGESGNATTDALVNATDEIGARNNPHGPFTPAPLDDRYDYNRDRLVNATDQILARNNRTSPFTALKLIKPPLESGGDGEGEGEGEGEAPGFRLQAPGSGLQPDTWNLMPEAWSLKPDTVVPLLNPSVFQHTTLSPELASDQHPTSRLSSAAAGDRNLEPPAWSLQRDNVVSLHRRHQTQRVFAALADDNLNVYERALAELLAEWDRF